jgi:hypothetical protein
MKIWPWSEISDLKDEITQLKLLADKHYAAALREETRLAASKSLVKRAHFRNPKTGRIGRKGQIFDV